MPPGRQSERPRVDAAWPLAGLVILLPLARGGVDPRAELVAAAVALLAALLAGRLGAVPRVALPWLLALGFAVLQLVPVPAALHALSPGASRVFGITLAPFDLYPAARPFSLAPGAGLRALVPTVAAVAAFLAAWTLSASRRARRWLTASVALGGAGSAATFLGGALVGLWPITEPHVPFVNPNHLAAATSFGAVVALGLALRARGLERLAWLASFGLSAAAAVLTLSRSGLVGLLAGVGVLALLERRARPPRDEDPEQRRHRPSTLQRWGIVAAAVAGVALVVLLLALDPVAGELRTFSSFTEEAKPQLWLTGLRMLPAHALFGIGHGAFGAVSSGWWLEPARFTYSHVENTWLQLPLDLGLPVGLTLLGGFALIWFGAARRLESGTVDAGLLAGLAALAVHELADFSLELSGVAVPAAVALGVLARSRRPLRLGVAAHLALLAALGGVAGGGALLAWRRAEPAQRAVAEARDGTATAEAARRALWWSPADYVIPATVGSRLEADHRCGEGVRWLSAASLLDPNAPEPHLLLARCLRRGGQPALAAREYSLAISLGDPGALDEVVSTFDRLEQLVPAVPATPDHLLALADRLERVRPDDAAEVLERVASEFLDERAMLPLAWVRLRQRRPEEALALARQAQGGRRPTPEAWWAGYVALVEQGDLEGSVEELRAGLKRFPGSARLVGPLVERLVGLRRHGAAREAAEGITVASPAEAAQKYLLLAKVAGSEGRWSEAVQLDQGAVAATPDTPGPLFQLAIHAAAGGHHAEAIAALERACAMPGVDPALCATLVGDARKRAAAAAAERQQALERFERAR